MLPDGRAAFFEIKTWTGRASLEQIAFRDRCEAVGAPPYAIARSLDEAEGVLASWGGLGLLFGCGPHELTFRLAVSDHHLRGAGGDAEYRDVVLRVAEMDGYTWDRHHTGPTQLFRL